MLDKFYIFFLGLFIGLSFLSMNTKLNNIENKIDMYILSIKVSERVQVLRELDFPYDEIFNNVSSKYDITKDELKKILVEGAE